MESVTTNQTDPKSRRSRPSILLFLLSIGLLATAGYLLLASINAGRADESALKGLTALGGSIVCMLVALVMQILMIDRGSRRLGCLSLIAQPILGFLLLGAVWIQAQAVYRHVQGDVKEFLESGQVEALERPPSDLPAIVRGTKIQQVTTLDAPADVEQLIDANAANLIFMRLGNHEVIGIDVETGERVTQLQAKHKLLDMDLSPRGTVLYVTDHGGVKIGHNKILAPHYVHRYELAESTWTSAVAPKVAGMVAAVDEKRFLLLERDQHVDVTLNEWDFDEQKIKETKRIRHFGYRGQIEYDRRTSQLYNMEAGTTGSDLIAATVRPGQIDDVFTFRKMGTNFDKSRITLSPDGRYVYYRDRQIDTHNEKPDLKISGGRVLAASADLVFSRTHYSDAETGKILGKFKADRCTVSPDGSRVVAYNARGPSLTIYRIVPQ